MLDRYDFEFDGERLRIFADEDRKAFLYAPDVARILGLKTRALARELPCWQWLEDEEGRSLRVYSEGWFRGVEFRKDSKDLKSGKDKPDKTAATVGGKRVDREISGARLEKLQDVVFERFLPELRIMMINEALKERREEFANLEELERALTVEKCRVAELEHAEAENLKLFEDNRSLRERLDASRKDCLRLAEEQRDALREANSSLRYARGLREVCIQMRGKLAELAAMYGSRHVVLLKLVDAVDEALKAGMETGGCQE